MFKKKKKTEYFTLLWVNYKPNYRLKFGKNSN